MCFVGAELVEAVVAPPRSAGAVVPVAWSLYADSDRDIIAIFDVAVAAGPGVDAAATAAWLCAESAPRVYLRTPCVAGDVARRLDAAEPRLVDVTLRRPIRMYDKHDGSWVRTGVGTYAQTAGAAPPKIDVWSGVAMVAADTDFGGLGCRPAEAARQRVAVLFVGEVRLRDADSFRALQDATAGCDGFVATYARHFPTARELFGRPDRVVGVDGAVAACEICGQKGGGRLISWVQLQAALDAFEPELRRYDVLVKTRTDLDFHPPYASLVPAVGRVHAEIFVEVAYAAPPVFYAAFGNCVDRLIKPWFARGDGFGFSRRKSTRPVYVPLNWTNALESDLTALRWRWLHVPERLGGAIATPRDLKRVIFDHLPELEGARTGEPAVLADATEACAVDEFASALCGQFGLFSSETFMAYAILQAAPACLIAGRRNLSPGNLYSLAEDRHAFTWAADDDEACPYAFDGGAAPPAADVVPGFASCAYAATFDDATRVSVTIDATADAANVERAAQDLARAIPAAVAAAADAAGCGAACREAQLAANIEGERRACFAAAATRAADVAARVAARLADRAGPPPATCALMSALDARLAALGPEDVSLKPFPHVVVDSFLPDGAFAALLDQFGALEAAVDVAVGDDRANHVAGDYKTAPVGRDVLETRAFSYGGATVEAQNATLTLVDALTRRARPGEARGVLDVHLARLFAPRVPPGALDSLAPGAARAWPYKVLSLGAGAGRKRAEAPHLDGPGTQAFSCLLYARDPADDRTGGGLELYENFVPDGAKYPAPADITLGRVIPYAANRLVCNLNSRAAVHASEPSAGELTTPRRFLLYRAGLEEPLFSFKEGSQAH